MTDPRLLASGPVEAEDAISPYALIRILLQYRYFFLVVPLVAALALGLTARQDPMYTSDARFMPEAGGGGGERRLAPGGLAAQLGLDVNAGSLNQTPSFYVELLTSREVLTRLAEDTVSIQGDSSLGVSARQGTVAEIFGSTVSTPAGRELARRRLQEAITATTVSVGLVRLRVTTPSPGLSQQLAQRLLELVEEFNLRTRQSSANAEVRFIEQRIEGTQAKLDRAEHAMRRFLESNRQFEGSPELVFEHNRLSRHVSMHQEVLSSLMMARENAQSAAVRNTPLITVLEHPDEPAFPDPQGSKRRILYGFIFGAIITALFAFTREFLRNNRAKAAPEFERFQEVWRDTLTDLRRVKRLPRTAIHGLKSREYPPND